MKPSPFTFRVGVGSSLTLLSVLLFVLHSRQSLLSPNSSAAALPGLQAAAAIEQLKQQGLYASLGAAMTAAQYGIKPVPEEQGQKHVANNPANRLRASFATEGLELQSFGNVWRLEMKLHSAGYGNRQSRIGSGRLNAKENRLEYERPIVGNQSAIKEWYVNQPSGLEQGFTLAEPPGARNGESLRLALTLDTELRAQAAADGQAVEFVDATGNRVLRYDKLAVWDARGQALKARMSVKGEELRLEVEDTAAIYPVTIDPNFTQQAYLKASNTDAGDDFGTSVAVSGDTVVVGADGESSNAVGVNGNQADNSAASSGAAYVFVRSAGVWTQQAYLKASNTDAGDSFGLSVAISGDTVVVGAIGEASGAVGVNGNQSNNGVPNSGAAYVFTRSAGVWTQQAYLKASNTDTGDEFGFSVSVSGDTVVVGARSESSNAVGINGNGADNSADRAGAAYVFARNGTVWTQQAYLKASNTDSFDEFGYSVAVSGDTVVVGAYREDSNAVGINGNGADNSASSAGAAYVFARSGNVWTQQAYLKASNTETNDRFGNSVAVSGDTVVVGAYLEDSNAVGVNGNQSDNSASASGAAYVFTRSGTVWTQQAYLKASNTDSGDGFGWSVAASGETVVVGANAEASNAVGINGNGADNSANRAGAAYVLARSGGVWTQQAYLKASNTEAFDEFGYTVSVSGDTVIVGAGFEDSNAVGINGNQANNSATDAGAVYAFLSQSSIVVATLADEQNTNGQCSLREAIINANNDNQSGSTDCAAGSGADTITFSVTGTITLSSALPTISQNLTINGPGASQLIVSGNNAVRVFDVGNGVSDLTFSGMTIANGLVTGAVNSLGAGIFNDSPGTVSVANCVLSGNVVNTTGATSAGGAIFNNNTGTVNITGSTLSGNTATGPNRNGAGIFNDKTGTVNVTSSTISGNTAGSGGGIYNNGAGTMNVTSSTISGNSASGAIVFGGGIFNSNAGTVNVSSSTIFGNSANTNGGGIYINGVGTVNVKNSIVAGNTAGTGPDAFGAFTSQGFNLIGKSNGSTGFNATGDQTGTIAAPLDPRLGPLSNNGGPTLTHGLRGDSPAIDAGAASPFANDQRGQPRNADSNGDNINTPDIGALEVQKLLVTNTNNSGAGSLRQAILDNNSFGSGLIAFNIAGGGVKTIAPTSALPPITQMVTINGYTQPGSSANTLAVGNDAVLLIELNGTNAPGASTNGLELNTGYCDIRGLVINRFNANGIRLFGTPTTVENHITGNFIGVNPSGTTALANGGSGISIATSANTIGGPLFAARNVISGNGTDGIFIVNGGVGAAGNLVWGNYIGTNAAGTAAIGNTQNGIETNSANNNTFGGNVPGVRNVVSGNGLSGILIFNNSPNNQVLGNYVGTNAAGTAALPNGDRGVRIWDAANNIIGGTAAGAGNLVSGNSVAGISIQGATSTNTQVLGNQVGTNAAGTAAIPNVGPGVGIFGNATGTIVGGTTVGARNLISGNTGDGVGLGANSCTVQGNFIGTDINGTAGLGNGLNGVLISAATGNMVGGTTVAARNLISGNNQRGVFIFGVGADSNQVRGNYIGTDINGSTAIPNSFSGVVIQNGAGNSIGGTAAGARNVISGNTQSGVAILQPSATGNLVQGNSIGMNAAGTATLPNGIDGVNIDDAANNTVGGTAAGAGNVIAGNTGNGVTVLNAGATGNGVVGNAIHSNGAFGIDLGNNGLTANDAGDADAGTNNLQNFPVLNFVTSSGLVGGSLDSLPQNTAYPVRIEFFANTACDASGNGEGEVYLGFISLPAQGFFNFNFTPIVTKPFITATATDANGNTSEFSTCRMLGDAPITVNTTADTVAADGFCSLREAIQAANTNAAVNECAPGAAGLDNIIFALGTGTPSITVTGSALPAITEPLNINGATGGATRIELNGAAAGASTNGLVISAGGVLVTSLVVNRFGQNGIVIQAGSGSSVQGCLIGTNAAGAAALANGGHGIYINNATNSTIGGVTPGAGNVISGNGGHGVVIEGAPTTNNVVQGNFIGTNITGSAAIPNAGNGVNIVTASGNTVGGAVTAARNVISGNGQHGVVIDSTSNNQVLGNFIGLNANGTAALANNLNGVFVAGANNTIGGTTAAERNIISGNGAHGVYLSGLSVTGNQVRGNYIGTNASGTAAVPNAQHGVVVDQVSGNTIGGTTAGAGNVISGNSATGVFLQTSNNNQVQGNLIGTNATGLAVLANGNNGITIGDSAGNTIGGTAAGAGNVISGNNQRGILISGASATNNSVQGNLIGTNAAGTAAIPNGLEGVTLNGAVNNTIGGTVTEARNIISGNGNDGVLLNSGATGNQVLGNFIGTNAAGTAILTNSGDGVDIQGGANGNTVGGTAVGARNLISGNTLNGVQIAFAGANNNQILGNYIGTNANGTAALGNTGSGVAITGGAANNTVGGTDPAERNVISGNNTGINIANATTTGNQVLGNYIGTNATGTATIPNGGNGVNIDAAPNNSVGGTVAGARNIISGNLQNGVRVLGATVLNARVQGNFIGTDATGTTGLGNGFNGVLIAFSSGNTIGGNTAAARNVISSNGIRGVAITGNTATLNLVQGNYIGTDVNGTANLGNTEEGVVVNGDAGNNTIGGTVIGAGNVISGNNKDGIRLDTNASAITIQGNFIGTTANGLAALPNANNGIFLFESANNIIGGTTAAARNIISGNNASGVELSSNNTINNVVAGNFIGTNAAGTATLANTAAGVQITDAVNNTIGGTAAGAGNLISGNSSAGVAITGATATGNRVLGNSISGNNGLGIDLGGNGLTANDAGDADTGPNNLQNFPLLTTVTTSGGLTNVAGTLNSTPSTVFRIEFFANASCDPTGNGEGQFFIGSTEVTTDVGGNATISATLPSLPTLNAGGVVTATATDAAGNTSEFSPCQCNFAINPTEAGIAAAGVIGNQVQIIAPGGCSWTAVSNSPFITVTGGASGSGNGTVTYNVTANPGTQPRTGSLTIAGYTFYATQAANGTVLNEGFGAATPKIPDDWSVMDTGGTNNGGDGMTWMAVNSQPCPQTATPGAPFSPPYATVDFSCVPPQMIPDESLVTPPFDARGLNQVILQFDSFFRFQPGDLTVRGDVDISLDRELTWTNILRLTASETANTRTLNLTPFIPPNSADVRVRFRFYAVAPPPVRPNAPRAQELSWGIDAPRILALTVAGIEDLLANGETRQVQVIAPAEFGWTVTEEPDAPWLTIVNGGNRPVGLGTGTFTISTEAYGGICPRVATLKVAIPGAGPTPLLEVSRQVRQVGSGLSILPASAGLPLGRVGQSYSQSFSQTGSNGTIEWSVASGSVPAGLTLNQSSGVLSGTPTQAGDYGFSIQGLDSAANGCIGKRAYTLTIVSAEAGGLQFFPLPQPVRLLETRAGLTGCTTPGAIINAGGTFTLPARTTCAGIPADAQAVTGNITVVPSGGGFLTLFPSSAAQPTVANSNFGPGEVTNNVFTVGLGAADGAFKIFASGTTHVIVDVTGYYAPPAAGGLYFHPLATPVRLLETRAGLNGCIAPGAQLIGTGDPNADPNLDLSVQGRSPVASPCNSIPASAQVLVGNATSVVPDNGGYLTIYPSGGTRPLIASSNYVGSDVINGPFSVKLGADGKFKIYTLRTTHLVVDILGYYSEEAVDANGVGLLFSPLPVPVRLLETRPGGPPLVGCTRTNAPIQGNLNAATHTQQAAGFCGLPASAQAVVGNVSVVSTPGAGFLTLFPGNLTNAPLVATSNYPTPAAAGYNRHYFVGLSPIDGTFKVLTQFTTELILDASGYFAP